MKRPYNNKMDYNKYTVKQLKFKLKIYGERLSGKKSDLIERLKFVNNSVITTLDTDRLIYLHMDDESLFNMCMVNSYVNDVICDDLFWCYRIKKMFGENSTDSSMKGSHKKVYKYLRRGGKSLLFIRICGCGYFNMLKSLIDKFEANIRLLRADYYELEIMRNILFGKYDNELTACIISAVTYGYLDILKLLVKRRINGTDIPYIFQRTSMVIKYMGMPDRYQEIKQYCEAKLPFITVLPWIEDTDGPRPNLIKI